MLTAWGEGQLPREGWACWQPRFVGRKKTSTPALYLYSSSVLLSGDTPECFPLFVLFCFDLQVLFCFYFDSFLFVSWFLFGVLAFRFRFLFSLFLFLFLFLFFVFYLVICFGFVSSRFFFPT